LRHGWPGFQEGNGRVRKTGALLYYRCPDNGADHPSLPALPIARHLNRCNAGVCRWSWRRSARGLYETQLTGR